MNTATNLYCDQNVPTAASRSRGNWVRRGAHDREMQIPEHCGHPFRRIADSVPVIADSF